MLRIIPNISAAGAKSYYSTASTADYYAQDQELTGAWCGKGAAWLGLHGAIAKEDWDKLCDNINPATGKRLTPRQKEPRRVGFDFNFHVPKSVSLLYGLTQEERILDAFRASVAETMQDMEAEMQTRVRKGGKDEDRTTGNMVFGEFVHFTARPVDGVVDPHLHSHCFVFNSTWDSAEERWKAGQFAGLKRDAPFFEAKFHLRLAHRMAELGLPVERTRHGWEIGGIERSTLERFSRRTALIEEEARIRGITDPAEKDALGAQTRQRKAKGLTMTELREEWAERLSPAERARIAALANQIGGPPLPVFERTAAEAVQLAAEHCFERSAVVPERRLLKEAMKRSLGGATPDAVMREVSSLQLINRTMDGETLVTTREVLAEEQRMLDFARRGRGSCRPLGKPDYQLHREWLSDEQKRAVRQVLASGDRITLVRGAAGTGKTTMMQEAVAGMEAAGREVFTFAPSAAASRGVLREEAGFAGADTVARLLVDTGMQEKARGEVIWVDEAGLLGSRTMGRLFDLAKSLDARLVLSGDRRQHGSVERGGVLRLLEDHAGLAPAELKEIRRQSADYKKAVAALSEGRTAEGFRRLDELGWIREAGDGERFKILANAYMESIDKPGKVLVISPTHREGEQVTAELRSALKACGKLGNDERELTVLRPVCMTAADRADRFSYLPGDVAVFHQNAKGVTKGTRLVAGTDAIPFDHAERFTVFRPSTLRIAPGDRIRITKNTKSIDGRRLNNGDLLTVKGFTRDGDLTLDNGSVLSQADGHFAHGYCVTSHNSQGKSVDRVIIAQSSASFAASSKEQFYVSVSRGKRSALIVTDDRKALVDAVQQSDERMTATELVTQPHRHMHRTASPVPAHERDAHSGRQHAAYERD